MPPIPSISIDKAGNVSAVDNTARILLRTQPGMYRAHRSDGLLVLSLDEGTGAAPREGEVLAIAGDVSAMPLLGLLNQLGQNRETGRLVVKREQVERVIILKTGDVASVGSNLARDRLGTYLVRLGKVTDAQLEQAQRETEGTGKRIGQVLPKASSTRTSSGRRSRRRSPRSSRTSSAGPRAASSSIACPLSFAFRRRHRCRCRACCSKPCAAPTR